MSLFLKSEVFRSLEARLHSNVRKMCAIAPILAQIESRWESVARDEIVKAVTDADMEEVYVAAFWLFYTDGSKFYPPYLSINSKSREVDPNDRWAPPEWKHGLDGATDAMATDYDPLMEALKDAPDTDWNKAIELHYETLSRVSQSLTKSFRQHHSNAFTSDFVACILDHQHGEAESERLARMSLGGDLPADIQRFFAEPRSQQE